jgi:hypothetical protein
MPHRWGFSPMTIGDGGSVHSSQIRSAGKTQERIARIEQFGPLGDDVHALHVDLIRQHIAQRALGQRARGRRRSGQMVGSTTGQIDRNELAALRDFIEQAHF